MNQKTKTNPTLETKPFESTCSTANKKTLSPILKWIIIGGIVLAPIILIGAAFIFVLLMFFVVIFIIRSNLNSNHGAQCSCHNSLHNKRASPSPSLGEIWSSNFDMDSTMPGSAANSTRRMFDEMRSR